MLAKRNIQNNNMLKLKVRDAMTEQSITALKAGEKARIVAITGQDVRTLRKLTVFGLLPGVEIEMVQTSPVYVLRIGNTELALDYEAAVGLAVVSCRQEKKEK